MVSIPRNSVWVVDRRPGSWYIAYSDTEAGAAGPGTPTYSLRVTWSGILGCSSGLGYHRASMELMLGGDRPLTKHLMQYGPGS